MDRRVSDLPTPIDLLNIHLKMPVVLATPHKLRAVPEFPFVKMRHPFAQGIESAEEVS